MFERFTKDARTVVVHAQEHARRLGHRHVGAEHVLLAAAASGQPAGAVLREHGVTADRVEEEVVRRVGLGATGSLFADLDRDALASIGVNLDEVRAQVEARFGPDALTRAGHAVHRGRRRRFGPRRLLLPWKRRRARRLVAATTAGHPSGPAEAGGRYQAPGPRPTGHIPFSGTAKKTLERTLREAVAQRDAHIGLDHVVLGLVAADTGLVPAVLDALGTSGPALRAAILEQYRRAS